MNNKRKTLKLIGGAWVAPTIAITSIPAHAQTSGAFCGGMAGVAGVWSFDFSDYSDMWGMYPDGSATRYGGGDSAEWSLIGVEFRLFNIEGLGAVTYEATLNDNCVRMDGVLVENQDPFEAVKLDLPLP